MDSETIIENEEVQEVENQSQFEVGENEEGIKTISYREQEPIKEEVEEDDEQEPKSQIEAEEVVEDNKAEEVEDKVEENINEDEESDEDFYSSFSKDIGLEIENEDTVIDNLKMLSKIQNDPEIKSLIDYKLSGGDMSSYYETKSLNLDTLQGKDLLEKQYMIKNSDLAKEDKELAKMTFEREYKSKYNLINQKDKLDPEELDEWMEENKEDLQYQEKLLAREQTLAKNDLSQWQKERTSPLANNDVEMTAEEIDRINQEYDVKVKSALSSYEGFKVPISDNESYNVVLDDQTKKKVQEYLVDPSKFFEEHLGITTDKNGNGHIDPSVAVKAITKVLQSESIGPNLSKFVLERHNNKTIESRIENPPSYDDGLDVKNKGDKTKGQQIADGLKRNGFFN